METLEEVLVLRQRVQKDKEAAPLILAVYLLKTVYKKEKQCCHSHTYCCYSVLFKIRGRSNVKDQINTLKILRCIDFFCKLSGVNTGGHSLVNCCWLRTEGFKMHFGSVEKLQVSES